MELIQGLTNSLHIDKNISEIANKAIDTGLKAILPDFIEDEVIAIKDAFIEEGFSSGIQKVYNQAEEMWNNIKGIFSGEFDVRGEIRNILQKEGILDTASTLADSISKTLLNNGVISDSTYNLIINGKKVILNILKEELGLETKELSVDMLEVEKSIENWKESYNKQDYKRMSESAQEINEYLEKNEELEKILSEARNISQAQGYIEKRGSIEKLNKTETKLIEIINQ